LKLNSRIKTILRTALLSIAALIVGLNVYSLNASRLAGDLVPMPMGVGATVVLSGSMEPTLSTGDLLIIAKQDSYQVDDVVVFQANRMAVVHRIVELYEKPVQGEDGEEIQQMAITQGDANNTPDDPIQVSQIKGTVVFRLPIVGYLINMIKTPIGTILILGLAIFLLERSFHKEREKDQDKLDAIRREIEKLKQQNGE
jgi:signal peptidase